MKQSSLAFAAMLVVAAIASPATVSAIECTDKQLDALGSANDTAVQKACPSLFADGNEALDPMNPASLTDETLKKLTPCKDRACISELNKIVELAPDCSVAGLNVRATYRASVKLCQAFNDGAVTVSKAAAIFGDVVKNVTNAFESILGDGSGRNGTEMGSWSGQTPAAKREDTTAAPTTIPKSIASVTYSAGVVLLAVVSLTTSLLL